jgi:hypothetical protein
MIVGITGHQDIGSHETIEWVAQVLDELISDGSIDSGITCLAKGADQMYAQALLKNNIPYLAIIASKDYRSTFDDPKTLNSYQALLDKASNVVILDNERASEQAFYDAGKMLVDRSDSVIAVWDGQNARGLGGTADIVRYALNRKKQVTHINTTNRTVAALS